MPWGWRRGHPEDATPIGVETFRQMSIRRTAKQSLSVSSFCIVYIWIICMYTRLHSLHISGDFIKPVSTRLKLALALHINRAFWVDCSEMLVREMKVGLIWAGEWGSRGWRGVVRTVRWRYYSKDLHRCEIRILSDRPHNMESSKILTNFTADI